MYLKYSDTLAYYTYPKFWEVYWPTSVIKLLIKCGSTLFAHFSLSKYLEYGKYGVPINVVHAVISPGSIVRTLAEWVVFMSKNISEDIQTPRFL